MKYHVILKKYIFERKEMAPGTTQDEHIMYCMTTSLYN